MNSTIVLIGITLISWGMGSFLAKLAANRIGSYSVFWDLWGYIPAILVYTLIVFKINDLLQSDRWGIIFAIASGMIGSIGAVTFYILLSKSEATRVVPLTALYPALTVILAFLFLRESINLTKVIGLIFSFVAIYLLNK